MRVELRLHSAVEKYESDRFYLTLSFTVLSEIILAVQLSHNLYNILFVQVSHCESPSSCSRTFPDFSLSRLHQDSGISAAGLTSLYDSSLVRRFHL
jgi:hypothetical protein